jgi:hypothetical protein
MSEHEVHATQTSLVRAGVSCTTLRPYGHSTRTRRTSLPTGHALNSDELRRWRRMPTSSAWAATTGYLP